MAVRQTYWQANKISKVFGASQAERVHRELWIFYTLQAKGIFMKELPRFSAEDGHIESVLIGSGQVKVSFQTWDCRKLTLIYSNVEKIISRFSVAEIGEYTMNCLDNGNNQYTFYEACEDVPSLTIKAEGVKIYEVGKHADINAALFDVGMDYIGNQIYENK